MRTDGTGERLLTKLLQEAPSCSNGRVLVFYRETESGSKGEGFQLNCGQCYYRVQ